MTIQEQLNKGFNTLLEMLVSVCDDDDALAYKLIAALDALAEKIAVC